VPKQHDDSEQTKTKEKEETSAELIQNIVDIGSRKALSDAEASQQLPARRCKNWLQEYLELTVTQEAPELFHLWTGISAIGASVRRHVYRYRRHYKLYPNLYIVLIATSADCKKSTAIGMIKNFYREKTMSHVKRIEDKLTPEGLIARMAVNMDDQALAEEGKIKLDGSMYIMADEMGVLLSNVAYVSGLMELLTTLYMCPDTFSYTTRHHPLDIHNACPSLLGASTPEWLATGMPEYSKSGGFLGRFVFVVAHKPKRKIAFPEDEGDEDDYGELRSNLLFDLNTISRLQGRFDMTAAAKSLYRSWYIDYSAGEDPRLKEYFARKTETVLKIAMILSMSTSNKLVIEDQHIHASFKALEYVERDMLDAFMFLGSTAESQLGRVILSTLAKAKTISRPTLLRAISHRVVFIYDSSTF